MKKFALLLFFVAFSGNYALEGSILVNTVSFADLPAKVKPADNLKFKKFNKVTPASACAATPVTACVAKVKACAAPAKTVARACTPCPLRKASPVIAEATSDPIISLLN